MYVILIFSPIVCPNYAYNSLGVLTVSNSNSSGEVELNRNGFVIDGKPLHIYSAEFLYYRLNSSEWADRLDKLKAAGFNAISCYVPWNWHEPTKDVYDFTGATDDKRNLTGLVNLVKERGFYMLVRPGPFIAAEWRRGGIPDFVISENPHILMRDSNDDLIWWPTAEDGTGGGGLPSLLHPDYIKYVKDWYKNVSAEVFVPNQYPDGPIISVQVDNEVPYFRFWLWTWDYNSYIIGENGKAGLYQQWLQNKYQTLSNYNALHGTNISDWKDIVAPRSAAPESFQASLQVFDWAEFHRWMIGEVLRIYGGILRDAGITVPLVQNFNSPFPSDNHYSSHMLQHDISVALDAGVPIAPTFWHDYDKLWDLDIQSHILMMSRMNAAQNSTGFGSETPACNQETQFIIYRNLMEVAFGLRGSNEYTVIDTDDASLHWVVSHQHPHPGGASIAVDGHLRRTYYGLHVLGTFYQDFAQDLAKCSANVEFAIGWYAPHDWQLGLSPSHDWTKAGFLETASSAENLRKIVANLLMEENDEFDVVNIEKQSLTELLRYKCIITLGFDYMDDLTQRKLVDYVNYGGVLIVLGYTPYLNEKLTPNSYLKDRLFPCPVKEKITVEGTAEFNLVGYGSVKTSGSLFTFDVSQHDVETVATYGADTVGYSISGPAVGGGRAVIIGTVGINNFVENGGVIRYLVSKYGGATPRRAYTKEGKVEVLEYYSKETKTAFIFIFKRGEHTNPTLVKAYDPSIDSIVDISVETVPYGFSVVVLKNGTLVGALLNGNDWKHRHFLEPNVKIGKSFFEATSRTNFAVTSPTPNKFRLSVEANTTVGLYRPENWTESLWIHVYKLGPNGTRVETVPWSEGKAGSIYLDAERGVTYEIAYEETKATVTGPASITVKPSENKTVSIVVTNDNDALALDNVTVSASLPWFRLTMESQQKQNTTIAPHSSENFTFSLLVPADVESGSYQNTFYVYSDQGQWQISCEVIVKVSMLKPWHFVVASLVALFVLIAIFMRKAAAEQPATSKKGKFHIYNAVAHQLFMKGLALGGVRKR